MDYEKKLEDLQKERIDEMKKFDETLQRMDETVNEAIRKSVMDKANSVQDAVKWIRENERMEKLQESHNRQRHERLLELKRDERAEKLKKCKSILGYEQDFDKIDKAELCERIKQNLKDACDVFINDPSKRDEIESTLNSIMYVTGAVSMPIPNKWNIYQLAHIYEDVLKIDKIKVQKALEESIKSREGFENEFSEADKDRIESGKKYLEELKQRIESDKKNKSNVTFVKTKINNFMIIVNEIICSIDGDNGKLCYSKEEADDINQSIMKYRELDSEYTKSTSGVKGLFVAKSKKQQRRDEIELIKKEIDSKVEKYSKSANMRQNKRKKLVSEIIGDVCKSGLSEYIQYLDDKIKGLYNHENSILIALCKEYEDASKNPSASDKKEEIEKKIDRQRGILSALVEIKDEYENTRMNENAKRQQNEKENIEGKNNKSSEKDVFKR